jgi:hypothetical protein
MEPQLIGGLLKKWREEMAGNCLYDYLQALPDELSHLYVNYGTTADRRCFEEMAGENGGKLLI